MPEPFMPVGVQWATDEVVAKALALWVVYDNPIDFPGEIVVRRQYVGSRGDIWHDREPFYRGISLAAAREAMLTANPGLVRLDDSIGRSPEPEDKIVETWI